MIYTERDIERIGELLEVNVPYLDAVNIIKKEKTEPIVSTNPKAIILKICDYFNINFDDLKTYKQRESYTNCKHYCYYVLNYSYGVTFDDIAFFMKQKTNTCIRGATALAEKLKYSKTHDSQLNNIHQLLSLK